MPAMTHARSVRGRPASLPWLRRGDVLSSRSAQRFDRPKHTATAEISYSHRGQFDHLSLRRRPRLVVTPCSHLRAGQQVLGQ